MEGLPELREGVSWWRWGVSSAAEKRGKERDKRRGEGQNI